MWKTQALCLGGLLAALACDNSKSSTSPKTDAPPGTVTDLAVDSIRQGSATLSFTEVDDGTGKPASYDIRYGTSSSASWASAPSVTQGTCAVPLAGTTIGAHRSCTALGLPVASTYYFELVAIRGAADSNPVLGELSNIAHVSVWPNEPPGFTAVTDYGFDNDEPAILNGPVGAGWAVGANDSGYVTRIADPTAPFSPPSLVQYRWPAGWSNQIPEGMGFLHFDLDPTQRLYIGFWWKASDPWQGHINGPNNILYLATPSSGTLFLTMYGPPGGPFVLRVFPGFNSSLGRWLDPNVNATSVALGQWHRVELLVDYSSSPGHVQWWMDGTVMGDYSDDPAPAEGINQVRVHPVWGGAETVAKTETDFFWYDHIHVSH